MILGLLVARSFTTRPLRMRRPLCQSSCLISAWANPPSLPFVDGSTYHALSDRLALPTYANPSMHCPDAMVLADATALRRRTKITLLCIKRPSRVLMQSRTSCRGKLGACHHLAWAQIVPPACTSDGHKSAAVAIHFMSLGAVSWRKPIALTPLPPRLWRTVLSVGKYIRKWSITFCGG